MFVLVMFVVLSVYDRVAQVYGSLVLDRSLVAGIRGFGDALKSGKESTILQHADDFDLVTLGTFDELTGELCANDPKLVITASALLRQLKGEPVPVDDDGRLDRPALEVSNGL